MKDNLGNPEGIGEAGPGLRLVQEVEHSVDAEDSVEPDHNWTGDLLVTRGAEGEICEVGGEDADNVCDIGTLQIIFPQKFCIFNNQSLF